MPNPLSEARWSIWGARVVQPEQIGPALIHVVDGRIDAIVPREVPPAGVELAGDTVLMPALVDTHVHVNEPGRTEWEGWRTATSAAALGGITTLADMPLNSDPVTTTVDALEAKRAAMTGQLHVDCALWLSLIHI